MYHNRFLQLVLHLNVIHVFLITESLISKRKTFEMPEKAMKLILVKIMKPVIEIKALENLEEDLIQRTTVTLWHLMA